MEEVAKKSIFNITVNLKNTKPYQDIITILSEMMNDKEIPTEIRKHYHDKFMKTLLGGE